MIAILKQGTSEGQISTLIRWIEDQGLQVHSYPGDNNTIDRKSVV